METDWKWYELHMFPHQCNRWSQYTANPLHRKWFVCNVRTTVYQDNGWEFVLFRVAGSPSKWQFDEPVFFDIFCMRVLVYVILCVVMISEENHHWLEPLEPDFMNRCIFHVCSCDICGISVAYVWSSQVFVTKTGSIPLGAPLMGSTCCHTGWGVPILYLVYEIRSWKDASLQYFHLEEPDFANSFMFSHARDFATFEVQQMRKISSKSFKVSHSFRGKIFS